MKNLENWEEDVLSQDLVLVEFWAAWSSSSKLLAPVIEELERDIALLSVVKVQSEHHASLVEDLAVQSIPTMMLYKNGEYVWTLTGGKPKSVLIEKIAPYV
jgi:thioredoxin 1